MKNDQQTLMDEVYAAWQSELKDVSHRELLDTFSPLHRAACILGNMNYQVCNGGWSQWHFNHYSIFMDDLVKLCARGAAQKILNFDKLYEIVLNVKVLLSDHKVAEQLGYCECDGDEDDEECEYCQRQHNEDEDIASLSKYDEQYYELDDMETTMQEFLNRFEEEVDLKAAPVKIQVTTKPRCKLVGTDGNIFALIGVAVRTLKNAGLTEQAKELKDRIIKDGEAHSYSAALGIIMEYVDAY